jgi:hypothetical protein
VFDCGQSDTFAAVAGTPISVNGDFASIDARAPRLSGSGEGTEFPPGRVPAVRAGSVVSYQWSVSWDDGSTASFWLLLTATGEADDADDPLADAITIKIDDEGAFLEYGNERQMALLGGGYQSETGQLVEWFERAAEVTRFLRVPRGARIEVDTSGGAVFTFAIGRPGSGDGYWIMTDDSEPPYDILRSDNLGPVQYVIELLVQRPDGSWVDAYFGIELFATDVEGSAVVPDVMGLSREEAERLIAESGLGVKVETITSGLPESEVFRVRPVPGAVVFPDTVVTIHVSRPSNDGG